MFKRQNCFASTTKRNYYIFENLQTLEMKISAILAAFTLCLFTLTASIAQTDSSDYPFTPGTDIRMTVTVVEPVCWLNAANEFNVYLKDKEGGTLLTLLNENAPKLGTLPKFYAVTMTDYSFILSTEDKQDYYFAVESAEEKQVLQILKYTHPKFRESYYGYGIAKHVLGKRKITLEQLRAAKSLYDVLEKL